MNKILNTLLLGMTVVVAALDSAADYVREDELDVATDVQSSSVLHQVVDLRMAFPVHSLAADALHGLMYSANSWERNAVEDHLRTATITAQAGTLARGIFTPDRSAALTVGTGLMGDGTVNWTLTEVSKKIYQLTHAVLVNGVVDVAGECIGYFDFSCISTVPGGVTESQIAPDLFLASGARSDVRVDLQEGEVRMPKKFSHVLPFVYSPTNFTGTVDGKSSRVSIVQLEGTDPDVTKWAEVPGTWRKLKEATDEGEVKWRAKKGVWKATFEIFDGDKLKETQIKYFDLRNATGNGLVLFVT